MTTRDPETVYVVLADDGRPLYIYRHEERAKDQAVTGEHVTAYDRRNEAERAHLEEAARILRMPTDSLYERERRAEALADWRAKDGRR